jgi:hypothetical protein
MKSHSEYLQESAELAAEGKDVEALRAHLNASFAFEEEIDTPRDYAYYMALGDRYTAAGYFEYVDQSYEEAMALAGQDPVARARVLIAHAGSSLVMERMLEAVPKQLRSAEEILREVEGTVSEDTVNLTDTLEDLKVVYLEVAARLGIEPEWLAA